MYDLTWFPANSFVEFRIEKCRSLITTSCKNSSGNRAPIRDGCRFCPPHARGRVIIATATQNALRKSGFSQSRDNGFLIPRCTHAPPYSRGLNPLSCHRATKEFQTLPTSVDRIVQDCNKLVSVDRLCQIRLSANLDRGEAILSGNSARTEDDQRSPGRTF